VRILHTESSLGWGGQEIRILTEAAGLRARGYDVALACPEESTIHDRAADYGIEAHALPIARKRPQGMLALRRLLSTQRFDVVNAHSSTDCWLSALAMRTVGTPPALVRTRHISAPVPRDRLTHWLYTRATAHTVTTGEAIRAALIRDNGVDPERVTSIPTGVDAAHFVPRDRAAARRALHLPEAAPIVGICATLRSWKGHRYLVEAMPLLAHRDAQLLIVGEGPQRQALILQVGALDLRERVRLAGDQGDVAPWLAAMDVFALPSTGNEGVPQALVQAMFAGIPCVTTDAGAIGEIAIADHTALVVPRQNAVVLAAAIDRLLADRALGNRLAVAARERVAGCFGIETMLDAMERVFHSVCPSARR
jgi:glycosyltransferase involved in cell wall biosynthesis